MAAGIQGRAGPLAPLLQLDEPVRLLRCCEAPLAKNLVLLAMDLTVKVFEIAKQGTVISSKEVVSFVIGCPVSAAAWSPGTQYLTAERPTEEWKIEIAVVTQNNELRLLQSFGNDEPPKNRKLAHTTVDVNDLAWCSASGYEQYLAAAGDEGTLQIWDLEPADGSAEPRCTSLTFFTPLLSVSFHQHLPKLLLVMDGAGVGRLVDWLASVVEPAPLDPQVVMTFAAPDALATNTLQGAEAAGGAAWQPQDPNVIGAMLGTQWSVWNTGATHMNPARPTATGLVTTGEVGPMPSGGGFRWCPTNGRLFAVFLPMVSPSVLSQTGFAPGSMKAQTVHSVQVYDSAFPDRPKMIDAQSTLPYRPQHPVDLAAAESAGAEAGTSVPTAFPVADVSWLPTRVGPYDVLLLAVGRELVPVPITTA